MSTTYVHRLWLVCAASYELRKVFLGVAHHATPLALDLRPLTVVATTIVAAFFAFLTRFGIPLVRRLGTQWNWLFMALVLFAGPTKGWVTSLTISWLLLIYLWDTWRDGDGRKSRARATADRWKRRLLERFRSEAPTPIPVPS